MLCEIMFDFLSTFHYYLLLATTNTLTTDSPSEELPFVPQRAAVSCQDVSRRLVCTQPKPTDDPCLTWEATRACAPLRLRGGGCGSLICGSDSGTQSQVEIPAPQDEEARDSGYCSNVTTGIFGLVGPGGLTELPPEWSTGAPTGG